MKGKEFRIGNLVYGKKIETVRGMIDGYVWFNDEANLHIELCQPIPLTEEWLLNLGFYKYKGDNSDCFLNGFETACNMRMLFYKGSLIKNINFVHQIQNLYFALTGEELTIKKL